MMIDNNTNHNPSVIDQDAYSSGAWRAPEGYKDLLHLIGLIIITAGIYNLVFIYKMTEQTNVDDNYSQKNPTAQVFLFLVPFYGIYWYWLISKKLSHIGESVGLYKDNSTIAVILPILSLGFIATLVLQNQLNQILCVKNGATINATGQGTCKNCNATFPNDAKQCPKCGAEYKNYSFRKALMYTLTTLYALYLMFCIIGSALYVYDTTFVEDTSTSSSTLTEMDSETADLIPFESATEPTRDSYKLEQGPDGKWGLYYEDGTLNNLFTGLAQNEDNGEWFAVVEGYVNWDYKGVFRNHEAKTWYYCEDGRPNYDATGELLMVDGSKLYIENGKVMDGTIEMDGGQTATIKNGVETLS